MCSWVSLSLRNNKQLRPRKLCHRHIHISEVAVKAFHPSIYIFVHSKWQKFIHTIFLCMNWCVEWCDAPFNGWWLCSFHFVDCKCEKFVCATESTCVHDQNSFGNTFTVSFILLFFFFIRQFQEKISLLIRWNEIDFWEKVLLHFRNFCVK